MSNEFDSEVEDEKEVEAPPHFVLEVQDINVPLGSSFTEG
jgi:hypothetical protein